MTIDPKDPRLLAQAPDLYAAAKAWALFGHCVWAQPTNSDCKCDWHLCFRAVAAVERGR